MTAGFIPPAHWGETTSALRKSAQAKLDANGTGTVFFSTDSANQRWVVTDIIVNTNQAAVATVVPWVTAALNTNTLTEMSQGNNFGASYAGNQDQFSTSIDVGPMDFLSVLFYAPPGQSGTPLAGVIANAVILGTKYTRRS